MGRMPFTSIFDVVINVDLKKTLSYSLSVKCDYIAMTFVTDESCFLFTVNTFFLCHNAIQTLPQKKKIIPIYEEKSSVKRLPAEGFI